MRRFLCVLFLASVFGFLPAENGFSDDAVGLETGLPQFKTDDFLSQSPLYRTWMAETVESVTRLLPTEYSASAATFRDQSYGDVYADFFTAPSFPRLLKHGSFKLKAVVIGSPLLLAGLLFTGTPSPAVAFLPTAGTGAAAVIAINQTWKVRAIKRYYQGRVMRATSDILPNRRFHWKADVSHDFVSSLATFDVWAGVVEQRLAEGGVTSLTRRAGKPYSIFENGSYFQMRFFLETAKLAKYFKFAEIFYSALLLRFMQLPGEVRSELMPLFFKDTSLWLKAFETLQAQLSRLEGHASLKDDLKAVADQVAHWNRHPASRWLAATRLQMRRFCDYFLTDFYDVRVPETELAGS